MKPVAFSYDRPNSLATAIADLNQGNLDGKVVSGSQSLGPMMNLRLARPEHLIDVSQLAELRHSTETEQLVSIGAAVTHAEIEDGEITDPIKGMMCHVARGVAYRVIRNKGTIGGSLAHADPAADWLTVLNVANATIVVTGSAGQRSIAMSDFVLGAYTTALQSGEIIERIDIPKYSDQTRWGYQKICRKVGEFAEAIGAVIIDPRKQYCRVVVGAVGGRPVILDEISRQVAKTISTPSLEDITAEIDISCGKIEVVKRQHLGVAVQRAIEQGLAS